MLSKLTNILRTRLYGVKLRTLRSKKKITVVEDRKFKFHQFEWQLSHPCKDNFKHNTLNERLIVGVRQKTRE